MNLFSFDLVPKIYEQEAHTTVEVVTLRNRATSATERPFRSPGNQQNQSRAGELRIFDLKYKVPGVSGRTRLEYAFIVFPSFCQVPSVTTSPSSHNQFVDNFHRYLFP